MNMMRATPLGLAMLLVLATPATQAASPVSARPLAVPYYSQGASDYCWAAAVQMVTQAARFREEATIHEIIGDVGIDAGGISDASFRNNSRLAELIRRRTGVLPDRRLWDYINAGVCADYIRGQVKAERRPVAVYFGHREHVLVIVGAEGQRFIVHDPQGADPHRTGYQSMTWAELTRNMGLRDKIVTLVVPQALDAERSTATINLLHRGMRFIVPGDGDRRTRSIAWHYDAERPGGWAWRDLADGARVETIPAEARELDLGHAIEAANMAPSDPREVSVWIDISAVGGGSGHGSRNIRLTLPPNSLTAVKFPRIPIDDFRDRAATEPTRYRLAVTLLEGSRTLDRSSTEFVLEPDREIERANIPYVFVHGTALHSYTYRGQPEENVVNREDEWELHLSGSAVPLRISGLEFRTEYAFGGGHGIFEQSGHAELAGRFSPDRLRIEELTITYRLVQPRRETRSGTGPEGSRREGRRIWMVKLRHIPFTAETAEALEYNVSAKLPAQRPAGFAIERIEFEEYTYEESTRSDGMVRSTEVKRNRFRNADRPVHVCLEFIKSATLTSPRAVSPPAGPRR